LPRTVRRQGDGRDQPANDDQGRKAACRPCRGPRRAGCARSPVTTTGPCAAGTGRNSPFVLSGEFGWPLVHGRGVLFSQAFLRRLRTPKRGCWLVGAQCSGTMRGSPRDDEPIRQSTGAVRQRGSLLDSSTIPECNDFVTAPPDRVLSQRRHAAGCRARTDLSDQHPWTATFLSRGVAGRIRSKDGP